MQTSPDISHEPFMHRALQLAYFNLGNVSPNPSVGALIVKDNQIISEGITQPPGGAHAELEALHNCTDPRGTTLYVTLEPCSHKDKLTPPCTDALINTGIKTVVIGTRDLNPQVNGNSVRLLQNAGIEVISGVLEQDAIKAHEFFFTWIQQKIPFVTIKAAMTLDGKLTWGDGIRKQISCQQSVQKAHELRAKHDAVLVGVNTVIKDNPLLTCRLFPGRNPIRIILDSQLKIPEDAQLLTQPGKTLIFCANTSDKDKQRRLMHHAEVIGVTEENNHCDLAKVLSHLGRRGITSLLVEGGNEVISSFLNQGKANKLITFISGQKVPEGRGFFELLSEKALRMNGATVTKQGTDLVIEGYL